MSKLHKECNRTGKINRRAMKKAQKRGEYMMYWMRVMDTQPQDYATAADWLRAIADNMDEFVEGNFQSLKKWTVRSDASYEVWLAAVNACGEYDEAKGKSKKRSASR